MALRAVKTQEEIDSVPIDQPILVELPGGLSNDETDETKPVKNAKTEPDDGAKQLQTQLEAAQAAQRASDARAERAERETAEARRLAAEATTRNQSLEGDIINGGLAASQSERDSAKQAFKTAFEAGDAGAMADAQSRIGRAEAKILTFESGAAEIAERKPIRTEPVQEQVRQQPSNTIEAIRSNPNLWDAEKVWLEKHPEAYTARNAELSVGYERAIREGLSRGTPAYFEYLENFMGYKPQEHEERNVSLQAPPSRNDRGSDGRPSGNRVTLTPEERAMAQSMGISETQYALGKVKFDQKRRDEPDKYK